MFTYPKECVLDPFNGVGTTTLAAEELDRSFVGIELSEKYHNITKQRHEEIRKGLDPFRKRNCVPTAKNNYVPRLKKQKYAVPKKELQLEIKRIASELGRIPTREEVASISKYPKAYFDDYFISWGEACAAARTTGMSEIRALKSKGQIDIQLSLFKR
jgi:site-specific DNA-methyltransferase (adenine-specific)